MKKIIALFVLLFVLASSQTSFASFDNYKASTWTKSETISDKVIGKLGFGLLNITAGWTAIPFEMDHYKSTNIYTGIAKGLYRTVTNTVGGVLHTATFPIPFDIPLPDGGVHFE